MEGFNGHSLWKIILNFRLNIYLLRLPLLISWFHLSLLINLEPLLWFMSCADTWPCLSWKEIGHAGTVVDLWIISSLFLHACICSVVDANWRVLWCLLLCKWWSSFSYCRIHSFEPWISSSRQGWRFAKIAVPKYKLGRLETLCVRCGPISILFCRIGIRIQIYWLSWLHGSSSMNHTLQPICFEDLSLIFMVGLRSCTDSVGIVIVLHAYLVHVPEFELLLQC